MVHSEKELHAWWKSLSVTHRRDIFEDIAETSEHARFFSDSLRESWEKFGKLTEKQLQGLIRWADNLWK
jgi:hypothetical protein